MSFFSELHFLCINSSLLPQLRTMATCHIVQLDAGVHSVPDFFPDTKIDVLIQEEQLGKRVLLQGLERLDCLTVFWARDPHLNSHWQTPYARLFDLVCSTQKRWAEHFMQQGATAAAWLTWSGTDRPFVSWEQRLRNIAFVARVKERPIRQFMSSFLQAQYGVAYEDNLGREEMFCRYEQTRIVPNEAILAEVNMRLFEGASCGCVVVGQKSSEDIEELFEPDREIFLFDHVLEMQEQIDWLLTHPRAAEKIGHRARERVRAEHLPVHRAQKLINLIAQAGKSEQPATLRICDFWLTLHALFQTDSLFLSQDMLGQRLRQLKGESPRMTTALVQHLHKVQKMRELEALLMEISRSAPWAGDLLLYHTCSSAALIDLKNFNLAKYFWHTFLRTEKKQPTLKNPETGFELLLAWATLLSRQNLISRPGFPFDPSRHLPETALEALLVAGSLSDNPAPAFDRIQNLLRGKRGYDEYRLRHLSWLGLRRPKDWRLGLQLGLCNLRVFRKQQGLEELFVALDVAREQGQESSFFRVLKGADPSGLVREYLL